MDYFDRVVQTHRIRNKIHNAIMQAHGEGKEDVRVVILGSDRSRISWGPILDELLKYMDIYWKYPGDSEFFSLVTGYPEGRPPTPIERMKGFVFGGPSEGTIEWKIIFRDVNTYLDEWKKWSLE